MFVKRVLMCGLVAALSTVTWSQFNTVDAVTSASTRFQIKSGKAYETSAEITWWDYYSNGSQHLLKWGTTTSYGSQVSLKPFTARTDVTTTITGLTKGTLYYGQFSRVWEGTPRNTNFSFRTFNSATSVLFPHTPAHDPLIKPNSTIRVVGANGRIVRSVSVAHEKLTILTAISNEVSTLPVGSYVAIVTSPDGKQEVMRQRVLINCY